jgi:cobalamin-dependent methionine synthase I
MTADSCMDGMGELKPSHTRNGFLGIQKIKSDPEMKGVRSVQGVSNWVYGVKKRRVGHIRAYIAVAQKYGLDGAICDSEKRYGVEPAPPELMDLVETFVSLDGGEDSMMTYSAAIQNARQNDWI